MTGVPGRPPTSPRLARWERLNDISGRFLLPAVAIASLILGLALLFDPLVFAGTYIPIALFAIGLGVLAGFSSLGRWETPVPPQKEPTAPSPRGLTPELSAPPPSVRPEPPAHRPVAGTARGSDWRVLSTPADPGDETWLSWLPRERRRLGPAGGVEVSGVVRSPGKAGNLVAFPVLNYYGGAHPAGGSTDTGHLASWVRPPPVLPQPNPPLKPAEEPSRSVPGAARSSGRKHPFSEEDLDRMFPPVSGRRSVWLDDAPQRIGGGSFLRREPIELAEASARPGGALHEPGPRISTPDREPDSSVRPEDSDEDDKDRIPAELSTTARPPGSRDDLSRPRSPSDDLFLEAANPVPPHLRGSGPLLRFEPRESNSSARSPPSSRSVCASCSKVVVSLRMSGPCPKCMRPICNDCLRDAFVTHGHGWCVDCLSAAVPASAN